MVVTVGEVEVLADQPGRYSLAEAIYMNQQDLMYQLNEWDPKLVTLAYPYTEEEFQEAPRLIQETIGVEPTHDQIGFVHDRDVLAYYGDPKWNVRLQEIAEENDYTVNTSVQGNKCTVTIQTKENFQFGENERRPVQTRTCTRSAIQLFLSSASE